MAVGLPCGVTVKVYCPAVVPGIVIVLLPPPQLVRTPRPTMVTRMPSIARQLRRRLGMPKKNTSASTAPPPAPNRPLRLAGIRLETLGGVVCT